MTEEKKTEEKTAQPGLSRRKFIAGTVAGLVVGAAATYGATSMMQKPGAPAPTAAPAAAGPVDGKEMSITINGKTYAMWVDARWTLLGLLRTQLGLVGTPEGCSLGECGACTVIANGKPALACEILAIETDGWQVTTIEGLAAGGNLSPIQNSFIKYSAFQCGTCTPGFIMTGKALLDKNPNPSEDDVREAISGNLCRCGTYDRVTQAILGGK
jgi:aerobic-type carbon monoxide dehydrogenase small subunit (CoxS/CutS family)